MSAAPQFHDLTVARIDAEAAGSVAVTFAIPTALRERFAFEPGQFLTLRATIEGQDVRRSYSICSPQSALTQHGELQVGIRPVESGVFSNWAATQLKAGDTLRVMPPEGRFCVQRPRALHRVGFAAGSGITPILSIMASTLACGNPASRRSSRRRRRTGPAARLRSGPSNSLAASRPACAHPAQFRPAGRRHCHRHRPCRRRLTRPPRRATRSGRSPAYRVRQLPPPYANVC